jgi:hypothetical protein
VGCAQALLSQGQNVRGVLVLELAWLQVAATSLFFFLLDAGGVEVCGFLSRTCFLFGEF